MPNTSQIGQSVSLPLQQQQQPLTDNPTFFPAFYIKGTEIPDVTFDVGESYAGFLPVNASAPEADVQKFFFWFFPTVNPAGKDDIVIWFNGGPGCSSMEGFMQENGPWSWKYGTYRPTPNAYSWHKLANVIW